MCLIVISYKVHPEFPLVLVANRDENYQRPSKASHFWSHQPSILAGQDVEYGGTWLGICKSGRFAAVTNYREGSKGRIGIKSRGLLVSEYLQNSISPVVYLEQCLADIENFSGFNLLVGNQESMYFLSSRKASARPLTAGTYGISNGDLDSKWPKVEWAKEQLASIVETNDSHDHEALLTILADTRMPDDASLPDTGIGVEWERILAPVFINSEKYGTRASTVLTIDNQDNARFSERNYDHKGISGTTLHHQFVIETRG